MTDPAARTRISINPWFIPSSMFSGKHPNNCPLLSWEPEARAAYVPRYSVVPRESQQDVPVDRDPEESAQMKRLPNEGQGQSRGSFLTAPPPILYLALPCPCSVSQHSIAVAAMNLGDLRPWPNSAFECILEPLSMHLTLTGHSQHRVQKNLSVINPLYR